MARIVVVGGSLPGMAAAARLAKAGHQVTIVEKRDRLGGRLAEPGAWAPVLTFPAPLKDLFRKSGRAFEAEFGRRGLRLIPAPNVEHHFADGTRLSWPTDRAEQWRLMSERYSPDVATRWRDLLDDLDESWQLMRPLGLEGELIDRAQITSRRHRLDPKLTIEALARRQPHPHLGSLVRDVAFRVGSDPYRTPAWLATRLSVDRMFGRWLLVDADDRPQPATAILDVLAQRLATRGVRVVTKALVTSISSTRVTTDQAAFDGDAVISTINPWVQPRLVGDTSWATRLTTARLRPALAPHVTVTHLPQQEPFSEQVRHTASGPIVTYRRPTESGTEVIVHDHARPTPAASYGARWDGHASWLLRPAVRTPRKLALYVASASGRGGNEPWAQLLTAALATYAAHEDLTGEDIRPSNRDYKP